MRPVVVVAKSVNTWNIKVVEKVGMQVGKGKRWEEGLTKILYLGIKVGRNSHV